MWGGTVVEAAYPTSFGSAFGRAIVIDHDHLPDGSPGYWGLYAHLSAENVSVGQRVEAGQKIGDVGTTGNSSGDHLHVGVYKQPSWKSCGGINPQPWINAQQEGSDMAEVVYDYLDKPGGSLTVGRNYVDLDLSKWDSPAKGKEDTLVYLNITPKFYPGKVAGVVRVRLQREDGDPHAPDSILIHAEGLDEDGVHTAQYYTFELSEKGKWTKIQLKCEGGIESAKIGTRYTTKALTHPVQ
jgi:hypothetical protein